MSFDYIINNIYSIPAASSIKIQQITSLINLEKGSLILKADKVEKSIYFIKKGIVRGYTSLENSDLTFWFGLENQVVVSMKSYVNNEPSYENIELLEDCELYKINTEELLQLFNEDIHIANWGRKLAEKELVKTEERLISRQVKTATQRYTELLTNTPDLLLRVPLGHIASYLGITQVSLSRIRSKIK
jgi:CRP-like cAMP-binding protein